jgi:hypothetical protein
MNDRDQPSTALATVARGALERRRHAPWLNLRALAREAAARLSDRVRASLDLPDRSEMEALLARAEELDARLDERLARLRSSAARRAKSSVAPEP